MYLIIKTSINDYWFVIRQLVSFLFVWQGCQYIIKLAHDLLGHLLNVINSILQSFDFLIKRVLDLAILLLKLFIENGGHLLFKIFEHFGLICLNNTCFLIELLNDVLLHVSDLTLKMLDSSLPLILALGIVIVLVGVAEVDLAECVQVVELVL